MPGFLVKEYDSRLTFTSGNSSVGTETHQNHNTVLDLRTWLQFWCVSIPIEDFPLFLAH